MNMLCKKCGKFHDDGTSELCFDCLDDMATAPEDVQELTVLEGGDYNVCINSL